MPEPPPASNVSILRFVHRACKQPTIVGQPPRVQWSRGGANGLNVGDLGSRWCYGFHAPAIRRGVFNFCPGSLGITTAWGFADRIRKLVLWQAGRNIRMGRWHRGEGNAGFSTPMRSRRLLPRVRCPTLGHRPKLGLSLSYIEQAYPGFGSGGPAFCIGCLFCPRERNTTTLFAARRSTARHVPVQVSPLRPHQAHPNPASSRSIPRLESCLDRN